MPEEMLTTPTPEVITTQSNVDVDRGLEAALEKRFKNNYTAPNEAPIEESKVESKPEEKPKENPDQITIELKKEKPSRETVKEVKSEVKSVDEEKPLPNPETLEETPQGKGQAAWNALKNNYKKSFKTLETKETEITRLKASLAEKETARQKEIEALKAEREDLTKYRAMVDIQSDPDFVSKFDQPIEKTVSSIKEMLTSLNVDKATLDSIDFSNTKLMDEIIGHVSEHRDKFVAKKLRQKVEDLLDLTDKRNETLNENKKNYKELLESKKKESFTRGAEEEGRIVKHLESIAQAKDAAGNSMFPFLSKIQPRDNAGQPEIDQINNHNEMVELMNKKIQSVFKMNSPEERAEIAVAAVTSHYLSHQLKAANSKISSLQKELNKISNVSSETEKTKPAPVQRNGNGQPVRAGEALDAFFARR